MSIGATGMRLMRILLVMSNDSWRVMSLMRDLNMTYMTKLCMSTRKSPVVVATWKTWYDDMAWHEEIVQLF
jgi:predicted secreted Zn-dependent protease